MLKVICFKWNNVAGKELPSLKNIGKYLATHVNRLQTSVSRHLTIPHEFICVTDDPTGVNCRTIPLWDKCRELGGCFNRLYVFSEDMRELIGDRFVCIDLDVVVVGNLDELFNREDDFIINKFYHAGYAGQFYNGGLFMMNAGARKEVWERFAADTPKAMSAIIGGNQRKELMGTDQAWISYVLGRGESMFTKDPEDGVVNYRALPTTPEGERRLPDYARMVFFAGKFDPTSEYTRCEWIRKEWGVPPGVKYRAASCKKAILDLGWVAGAFQRGYKDNGYVPNVFQPRSLTEKLLHKKLFKWDPRMIRAADKVKVYDLLVERLGKKKADDVWVPKLLVTTNPDAIDWRKLPANYIVKGNNGSGGVEIVRNGECNRYGILKKMTQWMTTKYGVRTRELYYDKIEPQVLIEPLLAGEDGKPLIDYKFYMLNGEVGVIQVVSGRFDIIARSHYDEHWNFLEVRDRERTIPIPKPKTLKKMVTLARALSVDWDFVRVDLYEVDGKVKFGELTFFPHAGFMGFCPMEFDFELGAKLKLDDGN